MMSTNAFQQQSLRLQTQLKDVEDTLGLSITILDHQGLMYHKGHSLLGMYWHSHRKQAVCDLGFSPACVQHCRIQLNQQLSAEPSPRVTRCWKGVREIAFPLRHLDRHLGVMFAGAWRQTRIPTSVQQTDRIPQAQFEAWQQAWRALPVWHEQEHHKIISTIELLAEAIAAQIATMLETGPANDIAAAIGRFLRFNYHQPLELSDLAEHLGRSLSRTGALVREHYNCPFAHLLRHHRIAAAKRILSDSQLRISEVAQAVGYQDADYFSRCFKAEVGCSPRAFRHKEHQ